MRLFGKKIEFKNAFTKSHSPLTAVVALVLSASIGVASAFFALGGNGKGTDMSMSAFSGVVTSTTIKNETDRNVYARAYIIPYWKSGTTNDEYIGLSEWNIDDKINDGSIIVNDSDWKKSGNYYYYKNILMPGDSTTELVNKFISSAYYDNELNEKYNSKIVLPNTYTINHSMNKEYIYPHLAVFEKTSREDMVTEQYYHSNYTVDLANEVSFDGGSGTKADPYLISNGRQLLKCVTSTGVADNGAKLHYRLTCDIYLNDMTNYDEATGAYFNETYNQWIRSQDVKHRFCGEFDGDGYIVNGLHVNPSNNSDTSLLVNSNNTIKDMYDIVEDEGGETRTTGDIATFTGLFPCLGPGAVIKNVGVTNINITYNSGTDEANKVSHAGAIAGIVAVRSEDDEPVTIKNCFVQGTKASGMIFHSERDYDSVGGLVGYAFMPKNSDTDKLIIENTYVYGQFDVWSDLSGDDGRPDSEASIIKYRSATVGDSNNPGCIDVKNGYFFLTNEEYSPGGTEISHPNVQNNNAEDVVRSLPTSKTVGGTERSATSTNYYSHKETSNMPENYTAIKTALSAITDDELGDIWRFTSVEQELFAGTKISLINSESKVIANQAYKIAFELLQADGQLNKEGTATILSDTWGSSVESLILSASKTYLESNYTFLSAENYAIINDLLKDDNSNSSGAKWRIAGTNNPKQPTLTGSYYRYELQRTLTSSRNQSYADLVTNGEHLDKNNTPYMAFIVEAPQAGAYAIAPEFIAQEANRDDTSSYCLLNVNDEEYQRCNFIKTQHYGYGSTTIDDVEYTDRSIDFSANPTYVNLDAGINLIRIIMPSDINGTYDWFNLNGLWIQGNESSSDPLFSENVLKGHIPTNKDACNKWVHDDGFDFSTDGMVDFRNSDLTFNVSYGNYNFNSSNTEDCVNSGSAGNAKLNLVTFESLRWGNYLKVPYISFKIVNNGLPGYYDMELTYNTNTNSAGSEDAETSGYIVARVNGVNHLCRFNSYASSTTVSGTGQSMLNTSLYLSEGDNIITLTAPLSTTDTDTIGFGYTSWFNQYSVVIHGYLNGTTNSMTFTNAQSETEFYPGMEGDEDARVLAPHKNVLEAEEYASYNLYAQVETVNGTTVIGGVAPWNIALPVWSNMSTESFVKRGSTTAEGDSAYLINDNSTPHIDFQIYASNQASYTITPRFYFAFLDNTFANAPDNMYYVVMVNDSFIRIPVVESDLQIINGLHWYNKPITVNLEAGVNVVRFFLIDKHTSAGGYKTGMSSSSEGNDVDKFNKSKGLKWANFDYIELENDDLVGVLPTVQYRGAFKSHYYFSYGSDNVATDDVANPFERNALKYMSLGGYKQNQDYPNNLTLSGISDNMYNSGTNNGLPAISYTVSVPTAGYYDLSLSYSCYNAISFTSDTILSNDQIYQVAVFANETRNIVPIVPWNKLSDARADCSVFLKAGVNVITITPPINELFISRLYTFSGVSSGNEFFDFGALRISGGMRFLAENYGIDPHTLVSKTQ